MFKIDLYKFQEKHEENLLSKCADNEEIVLYAPTGSGKTVLACKFIDDYLDENPNTVFLWLCPGAGGLQKQSRESFEEVTSGLTSGDVYDFINLIDFENLQNHQLFHYDFQDMTQSKGKLQNLVLACKKLFFSHH